MFTDKNDNNKYKLSCNPRISDNFEDIKEDVNLWPVYEKLHIDMLLIDGDEWHAFNIWYM